MEMARQASRHKGKGAEVRSAPVADGANNSHGHAAPSQRKTAKLRGTSMVGPNESQMYERVTSH